MLRIRSKSRPVTSLDLISRQRTREGEGFKKENHVDICKVAWASTFCPVSTPGRGDVAQHRALRHVESALPEGPGACSSKGQRRTFLQSVCASRLE
ncbi:hypothetical protein DPEC_G00320740 [Dallia pectoralis]|uniref:Uncharacterized protein n=1 Tax=Dallia pectoralis TaxID=75939 RepID=A0ACC2F9U9_DALPE|nr:hypothetical protein DPEC_G00320740 [Dallia pectoralis]